jgi:hypothetical protein
MPVIPRPDTFASIGHPPDLPPGPCYVRTQTALAQSPTLGGARRRWPTPTGSPNSPHWQPQHRRGTRLALRLWIATLPGRMSHQVFPTPGPGGGRWSFTGPLAQHPPPSTLPALPEAAQRPPPGSRPVRPNWKATQGLGHRSSSRIYQGASGASPAPGTQ